MLDRAKQVLEAAEAKAKGAARKGYYTDVPVNEGPPDDQGDGHSDAWEGVDEPSPPPNGLRTTRLDTVKPKPVEWLVHGYLPVGKIVLFAGDGGGGKSSCSLSIAADGSLGRPAMGLSYDAPEPFETLLVTCEDDAADTTVPRLLSHGADLSRIHHVDGVMSDGKQFGFHLGYVGIMREHLQSHPEIRLIIVDPATAFVGAAKVDDHRDSELRSLLGPVADLAAEFQVTVLLILHLNKATAAKAAARVLGGVGYVNAARAAFVVADDPDDSSRRLILPLKANLSANRNGLAFRLASLPEDEAAAIVARQTHLNDAEKEKLAEQLYHVVWDGTTEMRADDALKGPGQAKDKIEAAIGWLKIYLADGPRPSDECIKEAKYAGFGKNLVWAAKKQAGVLAAKDDFAGGWAWRLPEPSQEASRSP